MKLKIKCQPEDFKILENAELSLKKRGLFGVYLLEKRNWNTTNVIRELTERLELPPDSVAYGGKKDKYGLTTQHISIEGARVEDIKGKDFSIKFLGFMDSAMGLDLVRSNGFEIVVRELTAVAVKKAEVELENLKTFGFPNFFDDQRFGSYDPLQGFFGEKVLKGHLNGALKAHLVSMHENDKPEEKERKNKLFDSWKKWRECCQLAAPGYEKEVFYYLVRKPTEFLTLLRQIPHETMALYLTAYQAFIWNELLRRLLKAKIQSPLKYTPGSAGDYLFYSRISPEEMSYFDNLKLQTLSSKTVMPDEFTSQIHEALLKENAIERSLFNKIKVRQAFFKSTERNAVVHPVNLSWESATDELYPDSQKLVLKFELPRDSYATMLIKKIFADEK